jgi:DNA-binding NarL/FixJ family response regulator
LELALGAWLRRQRRVTESRIPLRSAQVAFDVIGATAWAEQARAELRAAGLRPSDQAGRTPREVLSAQEFQIAELVAQGLSNREIGQRLYLSPRTIGSHLYRMFPKQGVTSRSQLAAALSGPSIDSDPV